MPGLLLVMSIVACGDGGDERPPPGRDLPQEPSAAAGEVCPPAEQFIADGSMSVAAGDEGDAARVGALRWAAHRGCERFVIELTSEDGEPSVNVGAVEAELIRELGVVRVRLRNVKGVDPQATDATFNGELARAAYAVLSPDGPWIFVDLHLASRAQAHVSVLAEPARVVVHLRPGGGPMRRAASATERVVVLTPHPGMAAYPLIVTGYARTFEANVVARVAQDGKEALETFTTATAWVDAWGHFSLQIDDGPTGPVTLHVGEYSARDGTWEGASMKLEMR